MAFNWKPHPIKVEDEYKILESIFLDLHKNQEKIPDYTTFIRDCAKIITFLQDESIVAEHLKYLNTLLVEEAKKQGLSLDNQTQGTYLKHKKVLRNVLERELAKMGFQPKFGKVLLPIYPSLFLATVSEGFVLKDPGAGLAHGEFIHAIQWLIIGWQQNQTQFLTKPIIHVYKQLGLEDEKMWNSLVDRVETNCEDFRSPERLQRFIRRSNDPDLSLLKALFDSRVEKRKHQGSFFKKQDLSNKSYQIYKDNETLLLPIFRKTNLECKTILIALYRVSKDKDNFLANLKEIIMSSKPKDLDSDSLQSEINNFIIGKATAGYDEYNNNQNSDGFNKLVLHLDAALSDEHFSIIFAKLDKKISLLKSENDVVKQMPSPG
ncbi:LirA/MavJ family T4SS effector [Legionella sp. WA2022007384]